MKFEEVSRTAEDTERIEMQVKEVVKIAKAYVADVFSAENPSNIGPERRSFFAKPEMGSVRFRVQKIRRRPWPSAAHVRPASVPARTPLVAYAPSLSCAPPWRKSSFRYKFLITLKVQLFSLRGAYTEPDPKEENLHG